MTGSVSKRRYSSPARQAQADATRQRILHAAATLFLEQGYGRTSTAAIGRAAGVSEAAVFAAWKTKADLLVAVISHTVGTDPDFPLRANAGLHKHSVTGDSTAAVAEFARITRRAHDRSWQLLAIATAAAQDDPTVAAAVAAAAQRRHEDCAWFVRDVLGLTGRASGLKVDGVWALNSMENYRRLVIDRGWPGRRYEAWLAGQLQATLA